VPLPPTSEPVSTPSTSPALSAQEAAAETPFQPQDGSASGANAASSGGQASGEPDYTDPESYPPYPAKKAAAYSNGVKTLSGYSEDYPEDFQRAPVEDVEELQQRIGKDTVPDWRDNKGGDGAYNLSHAEKQAAVLQPNSPTQVTIPICDDCIDFYTLLAKTTGVRQQVTDPSGTYIFDPIQGMLPGP
jgi:hypothetical protein